LVRTRKKRKGTKEKHNEAELKIQIPGLFSRGTVCKENRVPEGGLKECGTEKNCSPLRKGKKKIEGKESRTNQRLVHRNRSRRREKEISPKRGGKSGKRTAKKVWRQCGERGNGDGWCGISRKTQRSV